MSTNPRHPADSHHSSGETPRTVSVGGSEDPPPPAAINEMIVSRPRALGALLFTWSNALALLTLLMVGVAWATVDGFGTPANLSQVAAGVAETGLMMLPLTLIIIAREIDISVASIAGLASVVFGSLVVAGSGVVPAVIAGLIVGGLCGAFNGYFVAYWRLPSLIVTLGTLALFRGLCYVILGSKSYSTFPASVTTFGFGYIAGTWLPLPVVPLIIGIIAFGIILHRTVTGRRIYAAGGSPSVAEYSGVRVARLKFLLFAGSGLVCAVAGIVYTARLSSARADNLFGTELDVITIVFLGGVSFLGGTGRIAGVAWALALVAVLRNVLGLENIGGDAQTTAIGSLLIVSLIAADLVNRIGARRRASTHLRDPRSRTRLRKGG